MAGYWKNEKATREVLRDGWLYTGDLGYLDADGFLYVLGRMKSLLIASDGEKYSPETIEETISEASPYIEQIMLYNDQSPYTVALLVPNKEALLRWLKDQRSRAPGRPRARRPPCACSRRRSTPYREGGRHAGSSRPAGCPPRSPSSARASRNRTISSIRP